MSLNPYPGQRIGNLRERVELQHRTVELDEFGEPIVTWVPRATVWARVEPLKGEERFAAQQVIATLGHRVHIRYRDDLSTLDRVIWEGQQLDVQAVTHPDERKRYTVLDCARSQTHDPLL
ncbi:MAG: phage head closure protein [Methyloceanibacter sp.]